MSCRHLVRRLVDGCALIGEFQQRRGRKIEGGRGGGEIEREIDRETDIRKNTKYM